MKILIDQYANSVTNLDRFIEAYIVPKKSGANDIFDVVVLIDNFAEKTSVLAGRYYDEKNARKALRYIYEVITNTYVDTCDLHDEIPELTHKWCYSCMQLEDEELFSEAEGGKQI